MKTVKKEIGGRSFVIETGKLARQADGAALVQYGDTVVLVAAVSQEMEEQPGFLPLIVDYREKTFAAGKIPGGFYKREGRPTNKEILTMRLIDRTIRPMFQKNVQEEFQVMAFVLSADQENDSDVVAINGAAAALAIGKLPITALIASVRVGRIDDQFIINPTSQQLEKSVLDLVVSGSRDAIIMVEGEGKEVSEKLLIDAIFWGHRYIKEIIAMQVELVGKEIKPLAARENPEKARFGKKIEQQFFGDICTALQPRGKKQREKRLKDLYGKIKTALLKEGEESKEKLLHKAYEDLQKKTVRKWITEGKRLDGRGLKDIRPINCEVGLLPRAHGSANFTRGETQAVVSTTLGTARDSQTVEGLMPEYSKPFMLHYNFPPFCVGEVRMPRGPSRRDIGHGALAERSIEHLLPPKKYFPYTIRVVSEILESNGSSSMATVCGGTLALMDAGVPIKRPVAGIAMGLVKEGKDFYILSDIMGTEDHYGDMDFKVAGTPKGITGLQMDIKIDGISREILVKALEQARAGRIHILREMMNALGRPRKEISKYAPRVFQIQVPPNKISLIIGPGGKTIRNIQDLTGAQIDIKDDGSVMVYCKSKDGAMSARDMVQQLTEEVKVGQIYKGKVTSVKDFGAFVEIIPGMEGLVHVSELEKNYVQNVGDVVKVGDEISVKVLAIDDQNRIKLSKRAAEREKKRKD